LLAQARQLAQEQGLDFEEYGLLPVAEGIALVEGGETEVGLRLLADAVHFLEQRQAKRELARARFLLARAYLLAGDQLQALAELGRTMDLAKEIGTAQFAVVEGQYAGELVELGLARGIPGCHDVAERVQQLRTCGAKQIQGYATEREATVHRLELYALGEGRVVRDGHPISPPEWQAAMVKELFFYILMYGPSGRDAIGAIFWPDASTKKMADSFHSTLYRIRHAAGTDAGVEEGGQYRLGDVDYWFDVEEFEALVERARLLPPQDWQAEDLWRRAVALYRGDLLPEVERVWCVPKRETLHEMYIEALVGIGQCYTARRNFEEAINSLSPTTKKERNEMRDKVRSLAETLFALDEPWQGRFLDLVANLATNSVWDGRRPTREEVTVWLSADLNLYQEVKLLLDAWRRPKQRTLGEKC